jgi:hypothetical protein
MRQDHRPARLKSRLALEQAFVAKPALGRRSWQCGGGARNPTHRDRCAERQRGA